LFARLEVITAEICVYREGVVWWGDYRDVKLGWYPFHKLLRVYNEHLRERGHVDLLECGTLLPASRALSTLYPLLAALA